MEATGLVALGCLSTSIGLYASLGALRLTRSLPATLVAGNAAGFAFAVALVLAAKALGLGA